VWFIRQDRIATTGLPDHYWPGAPDLAVEVRSRHDRWAKIAEKVEEYLDLGTQIVWVVDPKKRTVVEWRRGAAPLTLTLGDELDGRDVVPGFRFPVSRLFD
jgi:Uma2 family endonuclease